MRVNSGHSMYSRIRSESRPTMSYISENNNDRPKQEETINYLHPVISEVFRTHREKDRGTRGRCLYEIRERYTWA